VVTQVSERSERMPGGVKAALVGVWIQAVFNFLGALFLMMLVNDRLDHNQEVEQLGLVRFSTYSALCAAIALVVSGIFAWKRFGWVRITVVAVEAVIVLFSLINFFVGGMPTAVVGMIVAILIAKTMLGAPGREWFNR
jgi:hypothetical protein